MKVFKKNQLAILVISLMLITAGYLNYDASQAHKADDKSSSLDTSVDLAALGDAELVNSNVVQDNVITNKLDEDKDKIKEDAEDIKEAEETSLDTEIRNEEDDYFATSKLERNVMYSQMIERYQEILNSSSDLNQEKAIAQQEINKINELQNSIMIAENLLTTKGFNQNIIFVNGDSINVIIGKEELVQDEVAQIQNIISRELKAEVSNIHISLK